MAYKISNEAERAVLTRQIAAYQAMGTAIGRANAERIQKLLDEELVEAPPKPPKPVPPIAPAPVPKPPKPAPVAPPPAPTPPPAPPPEKPTVKPELIIERTPYPKWWKDEGVAAIRLAGAGSQIVVSARGDYSLYVGAIVFTVTAETDIVLTFGQAGASGPMSFGGSDEPRGISIPMGNSPAPCGSGSFVISSDGAGASVQGFVTYYLWKK